VKKPISILLIFLITFNAGGYFFIYFQLENHFKQKAYNKINDVIPIEELELIKLPRNGTYIKDQSQFNRLGNKEILYYGKMYDIYKEVTLNDTLYLYCLNDENEDIIEKAFAEYINNKNYDNSISSVANIIKILITLAIQPNNTDYKHIQIYNNLSFNLASNTQNICIEIPSPPPKSVS
jgi:hypothetical protein